MRRFRGQKGEGQLGCVFGLIVLLIGVFVAYKMIPVKVKAAELRGEVVDEAKQAGMRSDAQIRAVILATALREGLPVTEEAIKITRGGNQITVDVQYVVPLEFPGFTYQWKFHHRAENPIF